MLDNLFDEQIATILDGWGGASADDIAAVIAKRARECSLGDTEVTPWTLSLAEERGTTEVETRGKVDDVTVLAVKVPNPNPNPNPTPNPSPNRSAT